MWHIALGVVILGSILSLLFVGMYKLSGRNNICKRGQWATEDVEEQPEIPPSRVGCNVEWLELQVPAQAPDDNDGLSVIYEAGA